MRIIFDAKPSGRDYSQLIVAVSLKPFRVEFIEEIQTASGSCIYAAVLWSTDHIFGSLFTPAGDVSCPTCGHKMTPKAAYSHWISCSN